MPNREPHDGDPDKILADIRRARQFARIHFHAYVNEEETPSHLLDPKTFKVEFPDATTMLVGWVVFGIVVTASTVMYHLVWDATDRPIWRGRFMFSDLRVGDIHVPDKIVKITQQVN